MALLPAALPLWAYLAAGAGAFAAAKVASGSAVGAGPAAPGGTTPPAAPDAGAGDLWSSWGDQGTQFGGGGSIGFLPGVGMPGTGDELGGQPVAPPPVAPPPPPAAPTGPRQPSGPRPSEAVGWVGVTGVAMYPKSGSWTAYPGPVGSLRSTGMTGSRYVSGPRTVLVGTARKQVSVRRVANVEGTWGNWFVPVTVPVKS